MTRAILSLVILICCVHGAAGQDQRGKEPGDRTRGEGPVRSACQAEIEKFCRGEERAGRCLRNQNPNELSEGCKTALAERG
jgi:hypothetical protein